FTIPAAQGGKPSRKRQRVNVRIHYIVGNHDWFLHLPGKEFNPVRRRLKEVMGLHNNPAQPFPHNPGDIPVLSNALRAHEVVARHGDEYDSLNFHGNRATASVGDAIVIELVCKFYQQVTDRFGAQLSSSCIQALREIDNVRPLSSIPGWIHGLLLRTCEDSALRDQIAETWNELAREFLNLPFVKSHDTPFTLERIDWLQGLLKLGGIIGLGRAARVAQHPVMEWLIPRESYSQFALAEPAIVDGSARFVVYGHTHHHEVIPISRTKDEREQFYINSGTWRRIHELGQLDRADLRFLDYSVMTTVAFFRDGERKGRRFEVWNGALDNIKKDYE
ncbi:MAG TPA: hypothetical protein PK869_04330, partial [Candidatus Hydrogenedentes bacterium]|nr:hypothetical protein [Candidatus Hydrogenedentota bacterium]